MKKKYKIIIIVVSVLLVVGLVFFGVDKYLKATSTYEKFKVEDKSINTKNQYLKYLKDKFGDAKTNIDFVRESEELFFFEKREKKTKNIVENYEINRVEHIITVFRANKMKGK